MNHIMTKNRIIRAGEKVISDSATENSGKVRLGDGAPVFRPSTRPIRAGERVISDSATENSGKVRLGDGAPVFRPFK